jgi:NitT/TauT family transport system substrate-binding protein
MEHSMLKFQLSRWLLVLGTLLLAASATSSSAQGLKKFVFILDFLPYGEYSPYFTAKAKGFYKDEGLDVEILRGAGSSDTIKRVLVGQGNAGSSDFATMIGARVTEGAKVRGIAAYLRRTSNAIFVRADSGINAIKDLQGKKIGTTPGNSHFVLWPIIAAQGGIPADSVTWVTMDGTALGPALISRQLDAAPFGAQHEARLQKQAKEMGNVSLKVFKYADYGLDSYGLTTFASDEAIQKDPELLKAFLRATLRGLKYAFDGNNFEECAKYVVAENPVVDLDAAIGAGRAAAALSITEEIKSGKVAFGQFEPDRVKTSRDITAKYLQLKGSVEVSDLYTNALLPQVR